MGVKAKVSPDQKSITRFHAALNDLARISGRDFETVMKSEVSALLTAAQRNTKKANLAKLRRRVRERQYYTINGTTYRLSNRLPDAVHQEIMQRQERALRWREQARGLASRMWLHIANALGVEIRGVPAYVRNAASGSDKKDMAQAVQAFQSGSGKTYRIGFVNALTDANVGAGAGYAFSRALNARASYFSQSVKLAAKGIIKRALDRYPGLARVS